MLKEKDKVLEQEATLAEKDTQAGAPDAPTAEMEDFTEDAVCSADFTSGCVENPSAEE